MLFPLNFALSSPISVLFDSCFPHLWWSYCLCVECAPFLILNVKGNFCFSKKLLLSPSFLTQSSFVSSHSACDLFCLSSFICHIKTYLNSCLRMWDCRCFRNRIHEWISTLSASLRESQPTSINTIEMSLKKYVDFLDVSIINFPSSFCVVSFWFHPIISSSSILEDPCGWFLCHIHGFSRT